MRNSIRGLYLVIFVLLFSVNAGAFQYERYKWGVKQADILKILEENGKIAFQEKNALVYDDTIFDVTFRVKLLFLPDSGELYQTEIKRSVQTVVSGDALNQTVAVGDKLKDILTEKYGTPKDESDFALENDLLWEDKGTKDTIKLLYSKSSWFGNGQLHVTCTYSSGRYQNLVPKQNRTKDAAKF